HTGQRERADHRSTGRSDGRQRRLERIDPKVKQPMRMNTGARGDIAHRANGRSAALPGEGVKDAHAPEVEQRFEIPPEQLVVVLFGALDVGGVERIPSCDSDLRTRSVVGVSACPTATGVAGAVRASPDSHCAMTRQIWVQAPATAAPTTYTG